MANAEYIIAGYAVTAVAIAGYRWQLSRRANRARQLIVALKGRPTVVRRHAK